MKRKWAAVLIGLVFTLFLNGCGSSNHYMIKNTDKWQKVTSNFEGQWEFTEFKEGNIDRLAAPFETAKITFDFNSRKSLIQLRVSDTYVQNKLQDWHEKWPDLVVDDYIVLVHTSWHVDKGGDLVLLTGKEFDLKIAGRGSNLEGFQGWEKSKFATGANAGAGGGLGGLAMSLAAKTATGTSELIPYIPERYEFRFVDGGNSLIMNSRNAVPKATYRMIRTAN